MSYKWKPNKEQKKQFALNMQDATFANKYYSKKEAKREKNRSLSVFDYPTAGGKYIPTESQHDTAMKLIKLNGIPVNLIAAANQVIHGYICQEKINHDYIHIINEYQRSNNI